MFHLAPGEVLQRVESLTNWEGTRECSNTIREYIADLCTFMLFRTQNALALIADF